jgi:2-polyprenyl-3-methyl-5-hydroxy-6-metoxy-1,4-benzoquinol methylase
MNSDEAWSKWGKTDPYFGVLTHSEYRSDTLESNREQFFASGVRKIDSYLERYRRMIGDLPMGSALDFGCGVGRLSLALSRQFGAVTGVDISPDMLAEAERNAQVQRLGNVQFVLSDDDLSRAPGTYDFVFTYIVIQHIPVYRGTKIIDQLLSRVRPGGGCMVHVSTRHYGGLKSRVARFVRQKVPGGGQVVNLIRGRPMNTPTIDMNEYDVPEIVAQFDRAGMKELIVFAEDHGNVQTMSFMAQRPA